MESNRTGQALQYYKTGFHNKQLLHFLSTKCPNLKSLNLPCCYGNQLDVGFLPRCLTHLSIDFSLCGHVLEWERNDKKLFGALTTEDLPHLRSFYVRGLSEEGQSGLDQFLIKVSRLRNLRKLHLHTLSFKQEEVEAVRKDFFQNMPELRVLILETCVIMGKPTACVDLGQRLLKYSPKLNLLYTIHSNFLTPKDLDTLSLHPCLETLILDWCPGLTLEGAIDSLQTARHLKKVYFSPYGKGDIFKSDPFSYDIPFRSIHRSYKEVQSYPGQSSTQVQSSSSTLSQSSNQGQSSTTEGKDVISPTQDVATAIEHTAYRGPRIFSGRKLYCHKYMRQIVKLLVEERQKLVAVRDNIKERMCTELGSISQNAFNVLSSSSDSSESDLDSNHSMLLSDETFSESDDSCNGSEHSDRDSFVLSECSECEDY